MLFSGLTLDVDPTIVLVIGLIVIPFIFLNTLVFRPFLKVFDERHERIEGALERANAKIDEAEAKARSFAKQIEVARTKGLEARDRIRAAAQKSMTERVAAEQKKIDARMATEVSAVAKARAEGLAAVDAEAQRLAELTATKLLGRGV